jgi:hypothetical protein
MMSAGAWTEGDEWAYTWCVMQDLPGLVDLMGVNHYNTLLDQHFSGGHNNHTNEPCHHYGYLYNYSGQPWKTQSRVRSIANSNYSNGANGLTGNEDCGQMSAWFIFSSMGFYPVTPGSKYYAIGSPIFDTSTITIGTPYAPATFKIIAKNNSSANVYIQSAKLNGSPLTVPFLNHYDIVKGGTLEFQMGPTANQSWGIGGYQFMKTALADTIFEVPTPVGIVRDSKPIVPQLELKGNIFRMTAPAGSTGNVRMFTPEGRLVATYSLRPGVRTIPINGLSRGMYIARMELTGNNATTVSVSTHRFQMQ